MEYEKNAKKENFVYFIFTHEENKKYKIYIQRNYEEANSLEKIKQFEITKELIKLSSDVFRFKISPETLLKKIDDKYHILIFVEFDNNKINQYDIKFSDINKDFFIYDFNVEEKNCQPLSHEEQFEIYIDILRKVFRKIDTSQENEDFILSTLGLLNEQKKFSFYFYLLIFRECYRTKCVQELLLKFKPENINGLGYFGERKFKGMKIILNIISKNIYKYLYLKNAKDENELIELFYSILLYFNMNFQKDKISEMLSDEKVLNYLSKKLISFHNIYKDLLLDKNTLRKLIKKAKTFNDILIYITYIGNNIINFLDLIYSEFKYISEIYQAEKEKLEFDNDDKNEKKEIKIIDIEKYVVTQKSDDIKKLYEITSLILIEQKLNVVMIIKFSENLIKNYVEYFIGKNLEALQLIGNLINLIIKNYKIFDFKYEKKDIELIIHETGIDLINGGKLKNNEILNFIKNDLFFNSKFFEKDYFRPVSILKAINIEKIDEEFLKNWKQINLNKIFHAQKEKFYDILADLIKDIKYFGLLYELFFVYDEKKFHKYSLKIMLKKYIDLLQTFKKEKCSNFIEDTVKLISLIDKNKIKIDIQIFYLITFI